MDFVWLFAADEADAEGYGAALAAGEGAEIGGVDVVDDGVGVLAVEGVDGFDADAPEVTAEAEFFLDAEVEAGIDGKAGGVGRTDELLLEIDDAVGVAGAVLVEIAELDAPDVGGSPAPGEKAVGSVPGDGSGLLRGVKDGAESGVEDFVGVGDRAGVGAIDLHAFGKDVARRGGGGAVAIFAGVFEEKRAAGLGRLLIDVCKTVCAVAGEEAESEKSAVSKFLLPPEAGNGEARLVKARGWENKLAGDRAARDDVAGVVVKGVELALV